MIYLKIANKIKIAIAGSGKAIIRENIAITIPKRNNALIDHHIIYPIPTTSAEIYQS